MTTTTFTNAGASRWLLLVATLLVAMAALLFGSGTAAAAPTCTLVSTSKGDLTAAQVGGDVSGTLDATGCQIGVYYSSSTTPGNVEGADISGATYYGVFVDGNTGDVTVNVTDSSIHGIGETPFNGAQHGVAVYYYGYQTTGTVGGTVDGNQISAYQKGGIVVNGENATVAVTDNTVTGLGQVDFIAQNGVQFGFGANGVVRGNAIADNFYTGTVGVGPNPGGQNPPGWQYASGGLLLYQPGSVKHAQNHYSGNQHNLLNVP